MRRQATATENALLSFNASAGVINTPFKNSALFCLELATEATNELEGPDETVANQGFDWARFVLDPPVGLSIPESDAMDVQSEANGDLVAGERVGGAAAIDSSEENLSAANWGAIEISFLSDERVQIRNGTSTETYNYSELGFADGRSGKPNRAWVTLRALAEAGGIIRDASKTGLDWPKVEKRIQEIRKVFRNQFNLGGDPLPFAEGTGYQARFKISCAPSFES
jgi:hypothetical protein